MNTKLNKIAEQFKNPGTEYRGAPFWAWNGKLDPNEVRRQIRIMYKMGLGGFFMHSRVGLATKYLSKDWFDCVRACVDEAEKLNMRAWLYDEDRWPSGAAGGLVTKNLAYRMRSLVMETANEPIRLDGTVAGVWKGIIQEANVKNLMYISPQKLRLTKLQKDEVFIVFRYQVQSPSDWYNGNTYLDTLNPEAVKAFINVTHEAYKKQLGKKLGHSVPGIFTDEPNYGNLFGWAKGGKYSIPWTDKLPNVFRKRYGYNIIEHLPEIFLEIEGHEISQVRYHYIDCITYMFVTAFAKQIGEWCDRNNMLFTGHVLCEETMSSQSFVVGSAMRFYEYMQAPGIDILTEHNREYDTAKQVASVAHQLGHNWRLSETYGCTGWDFSFEGHKAISDWQVALGINLRCQHLAWYTMEGQAKRDYPAGIFYQSPWWELYPKVEDYFARVHCIMSQGKEIRDLLVIHPIESMWTLMNINWRKNSAVRELESVHIRWRDLLLSAHLDFDYGDEDILARHGKIVGNSKPVLQVGQAQYKVVLVPPVRTIRSSTVKLLSQFRAKGGIVVFLGEDIRFVDAASSNSAIKLANKCVRVHELNQELVDILSRYCRHVSIIDAEGKEIPSALYLLREDDTAFYLFVCNTGHKPEAIKAKIYDATMVRDRKQSFPDVRIVTYFRSVGEPVEFVPEDGKIYSANARIIGGKWEIKTRLLPIESHIFVYPKRKNTLVVCKKPSLQEKSFTRINRERWKIKLSEPNCLVLDRPAWRIGDGKWQKPQEILKVDYAIRDAMGIKRRGGAMIQPWARGRNPVPKRVCVELLYEFDVRVIPDGTVWLALEQPQTFSIFLNDVAISADSECGWWCDRSLRTIAVNPNLLRIGKNKLRLVCDYSEEHSGLEIVYLLGPFGVAVHGTRCELVHKPEELKVGDWVKQGLPFYSGSVAYCTSLVVKRSRGYRVFLRIPEYRGTAVRVFVNERCAGVVAWEPNELEITEFINRSKFDLRIEVFAHRRNSHGPLHHFEKWPSWTGPDEYVVSDDKWVDTYQLVPCGLMSFPLLITKA